MIEPRLPMFLLAECSCPERLLISQDDSEVRHEFWLRRGVRVAIRLPQNLTHHEADRLGRMIESLPFARS